MLYRNLACFAVCLITAEGAEGRKGRGRGGCLARLAARKNRAKIIYTAHGFHFYKGALLINWFIYYPIERYLTRYTDREGLPVNIVEAMACGTPVVCSKNRGHNSLIENNISGFLFSLNNIDDMTRCIVAIYKSDELAVKLGSAALENVKQYALDVAVKKMADIYKQFITPK
jgi:hypothetical protein